MMRKYPARVWDEHDIVGIIQMPNKVDMSEYANEKESFESDLFILQGVCLRNHFGRVRIWNRRYS